MSDDIVRVEWVIDASKIARYLLDPAHPRGGSKAKYLLRFGFERQDPNTLARALVEHALGNLPGEIVQMDKGPNRVVFEGTVDAPDGRAMPLRTVWEPNESPPEMRFVTAVPLTRRRKTAPSTPPASV